jgi:hypothetical protein
MRDMTTQDTQINVRISTDTLRVLKVIAEQNERSVGYTVRKAIDTYIARAEARRTDLDGCPACHGITEHTIGCPHMDAPR